MRKIGIILAFILLAATLNLPTIGATYEKDWTLWYDYNGNNNIEDAEIQAYVTIKYTVPDKASKGETIKIDFEFTVIDSPSTRVEKVRVDEAYIIISETPAGAAISESDVFYGFVNKGETGTATFTINVPDKPGTYYVPLILKLSTRDYINHEVIEWEIDIGTDSPEECPTITVTEPSIFGGMTMLIGIAVIVIIIVVVLVILLRRRKPTELPPPPPPPPTP